MSAPPKSGEFEAVFERIRAMFRTYEDACVVLHDEPHRYYLGTHEIRAKDGYRTWFGGVEIKKAYVSAHLIPVYVHPTLLDGISPALRKRMQGKSCFNFKTVGDVVLEEFNGVVASGAAAFVQDGRLVSC
jgi:hypothetical protein